MSRTYGNDKTIHQTSEVNVETDDDGNVVAVWFRCQPIAFTQSNHGPQRAEEMRRMYSDPGYSVPGIIAIELNDD